MLVYGTGTAGQSNWENRQVIERWILVSIDMDGEMKTYQGFGSKFSEFWVGLSHDNW